MLGSGRHLASVPPVKRGPGWMADKKPGPRFWAVRLPGATVPGRPCGAGRSKGVSRARQGATFLGLVEDRIPAGFMQSEP